MKEIRIVLSVLFGVYFTHFCILSGFVTPVIASALAGLIGSVTLYPKWKLPKDMGAAIYCGSFVGMGSALGTIQLLPAGLIAGVLMLLSTNIFKGFGGKLGFTAYVSSLIVGLGLSIYNQSLDVYTIANGFTPIIDFKAVLAVVLAVLSGFYSTIYINHRLDKSAVLASALPSFLIGFLAFANVELGLFIATFYSASFAGMLSESLVSVKKYIWIVIALIIITILFKIGLGTFGGSLGTMAFLSVSLVVLLNKK